MGSQRVGHDYLSYYTHCVILVGQKFIWVFLQHLMVFLPDLTFWPTQYLAINMSIFSKDHENAFRAGAVSCITTAPHVHSIFLWNE